MGYRLIAIKGLGWMGSFRVLTKILAFVRTALLARLLSPAQFGTYGVALLVLEFVEIFTDTGVNVFLIQEKREDAMKRYIDTAFVISLLRGLLIGLVILASAPFTAAFFDNEASLPLLLLIALVPVLRGAINPALVSLQKELRYREDFGLRTSLFVMESVVSIVMVFWLRDPIGMVWGMIAGVILELWLTHTFLRPTPKLAFKWDQVKEIVDRGKWVTAAGVLGFLGNKGGDIVTGRVLDTTSLGLYQMAQRMSIIPIGEVLGTSNRVTFPIFVRIIGDKQRALLALLKSYVPVGSLTVGLAAGLWWFGPVIVPWVLGNGWIEMIPTLRVMALVTIASVLGSVTDPFFLAALKQHYLTAAVLLQVIVLFGVIGPLMNRMGVEGAAWALLIAVTSTIPLRYWLVFRIMTQEKN